MQFLKAVGLIFKSSCFKHEEEVRAILTVPKSNQKFEVKYREKNGYIIPYIALAFQKITYVKLLLVHYWMMILLKAI